MHSMHKMHSPTAPSPSCIFPLVLRRTRDRGEAQGGQCDTSLFNNYSTCTYIYFVHVIVTEAYHYLIIKSKIFYRFQVLQTLV